MNTINEARLLAFAGALFDANADLEQVRILLPTGDVVFVTASERDCIQGQGSPTRPELGDTRIGPACGRLKGSDRGVFSGVPIVVFFGPALELPTSTGRRPTHAEPDADLARTGPQAFPNRATVQSLTRARDRHVCPPASFHSCRAQTR